MQISFTEKNAIVEELSAISANLGEITGGKMNGGLNNFWTLATALNPHSGPGNRDYQGAFRVGGDKEASFRRHGLRRNDGKRPRQLAHVHSQ